MQQQTLEYNQEGGNLMRGQNLTLSAAACFALATPWIVSAQSLKPTPPQCDQFCVQNIINTLQETRDAYMISAAREKARADALEKELTDLRAKSPPAEEKK
jgi:hypothetical protein